jgi:hypothetical protein
MERRAGAAVGMVALTLAACGGEDESRPSREQYMNEVSEICAANAQELRSIFERLDPPGRRKLDTIDARLTVEEVGPAFDPYLLQLRQVEKPEGDTDEFDALFAALERFGRDAKAAAKSERTSVEFLATIDRRVAPIDVRADRAELPACRATEDD